jgi:hypothetical protein
MGCDQDQLMTAVRKNTTRCRALGIDVPATLLARADEGDRMSVGGARH